MSEQLRQVSNEATSRYSDHKKLAHEQHAAEARLHGYKQTIANEKYRQTNPESDEDRIKESKEMEQRVTEAIPYQTELVESKNAATEFHAERSKEWAEKNLDKLTEIAVNEAEAEGVDININERQEQ